MRYAVYFCPAAGSALELFGRRWLAADTFPGIDAQRCQQLLRNVRRYDWHATLCAPFALAEHAQEGDLQRTLTKLAERVPVLEVPLHCTRLNEFLALRPVNDDSAIHALANQCVEAMQTFRAPLPAEDIARRAARLDPTESQLLQKYGYPYVFQRYRFHMTLSAPASPAEEQVLREVIAAELPTPALAQIDALTLCCEQSPGKPFEQLRRFPLQGVGA